MCVCSLRYPATLTEIFPCFFLSCKANARVKPAKTGHGPHSSTLVVICVVRLLFVLFYVLFVCKCVLPPGDNPIAVNKYIVYLLTYLLTDLLTYLLTDLLTYLLTPRRTVLLEKLTGFELVKKFPAFYGTRKFITASQVPVTCPSPEITRSSPYPHIPLLEDSF